MYFFKNYALFTLILALH